MKKIIILFSIFVTISTAKSNAQSSYQGIVDAFFTVYEKNPIDAYTMLFLNNKWVDENTKTEFKYNFRYFLKDLGEYDGYELISNRSIGESYVLLSYLMKYEREPFRIKLIFYKPKKEWLLQNFTYDTDFSNELEDGAKLDRQ